MRLGVAGALVGGEYRKGAVEVARETGRVSQIGSRPREPGWQFAPNAPAQHSRRPSTSRS